MFLRNAWYVAALDVELKDGLMPVKMLNERIVLYRKADGSPVALEDACVPPTRLRDSQAGVFVQVDV